MPLRLDFALVVVPFRGIFCLIVLVDSTAMWTRRSQGFAQQIRLYFSFVILSPLFKLICLCFLNRKLHVCWTLYRPRRSQHVRAPQQRQLTLDQPLLPQMQPLGVLVVKVLVGSPNRWIQHVDCKLLILKVQIGIFGVNVFFFLKVLLLHGLQVPIPRSVFRMCGTNVLQ